MSFQDTWVKCNSCSKKFSTDVLVGRFSYELQDGTQLPIQRKYGWCHDCKCLEAAEDLDPVGVQKQIDELRGKRRDFEGGDESLASERIPVIDRIDQEIVELERLQLYLAERTAPSSCLNCGSNAVQEMPILVEDWRHPGCGGEFTSETGDVFFSDVYPLRVYDENGSLLRSVDDW